MRFLFIIIACITFSGCTNSSEFETGEIKAFKMLKETLLASSSARNLLDVNKVISRRQIDEANTPVLFVQLENGQNGTLTLYPGEGYGETWLGADGVTITIEEGVMKATRGMRNDIMGGHSEKPKWSEIKNSNKKYTRYLTYLDGQNKTYSKVYKCEIRRSLNDTNINILELNFKTIRFDEKCNSNEKEINNIYFVDEKGIKRRSLQYHGPSVGYIKTERWDR